MKTIFKLILAFILIAILCLVFIGYSHFKIPTTAEMEEFFTAHQINFEEKNAAILANLQKNNTINTGPDSQIGYQWLEIQPFPDSYQTGEPVTIRYYTHLKGIGVGAFGTGIAYIDHARQEKIYPSIEAMQNDAKNVEGFVGYSSITENWYSFYWKAD